MIRTLTCVILMGFMMVLQQNAQCQDSIQYLGEVVVTGFKEEKASETSVRVETVNTKDVLVANSSNITNMLSSLPSVYAFSTTNAISKPSIRGLYGNRVLVLYNGLKLDNQQWQDEHGLGLANFGIKKLELVKGPLSVLYGTDACGGVINIIDEEKAPTGKKMWDAGTNFNTNTGGMLWQAAIKQSRENKWYGLRAGYESSADYSDGKHQRVLNSRYNGYYLKAFAGFKKGNWQSVNHYQFAFNNFGFVFSDMSSFFKADNRWTRAMAGPHHKVMLNLLSSENKRVFAHSVLEVNAGLQSNFRAEDEGGGALSLIMHLANGQLRLKYSRSISAKTFLVVTEQTSFEMNRNYGSRKIVPDANMFETNAAAYIKHNLGKLMLEYGGGVGTRFINSLPTPQVNTAGRDIAPFAQWWQFPTAMTGLVYKLLPGLQLKANAASGVRAPNLAELSANGLHEGIYTYELGDPNMKTEKNLNLETGLYFSSQSFNAGISVYRNAYRDFIYLQPTNRDWFGFPVYEYVQHNALIQGVEGNVSWAIPSLKGLSVSIKGNVLSGKMPGLGFLPYMPPARLCPAISYQHVLSPKWTLAGKVEMVAMAAQHKTAAEEPSSPGYNLYNGSLQLSHEGKNARYSFSAGGQNLGNKAYFSHLSRIKTLGFLNMGRNIFISIKIQSTNNLKP
ncbi:TonB-dependent receptor [bacterium]|nr:TonB-dependent receptor [bacterium]